jgi:transposase
MKKNIYGDRSQLVSECFSGGGDPREVLVVAMDLAKSEHTALFCRGDGEYLLSRPLRVFNTPEGVEYLVGKVESTRQSRGIAKERVLIGGEDPGQYTFNFIYQLGLRGFPFIRVNAAEASTLRNNTRASTDFLDLDGIGQAIVQQRGRTMDAFDRVYRPMKSAARARRRLVSQETACKNRIHRDVEILFPGFLSETVSGIVPFTGSSLALMEEGFSSIRIKRMRDETLVKLLRRHHTQKPEEAAAKVKALAARVLPPPPEIVDYQSGSLATKVRMLRTVRDALASEENEMARCLVQTPGFYLTTIPGMGVVLSGHIVAEFGAPPQWRAADNMVSYGGIVPRVKGTGGPSKAPKVGHLPMDANHTLKDYLLQAAHHVATTGEHRLRKHFQRVENHEGRSRLSTAKMLVRIGRQMVLGEMPYLPLEMLRPQLPLPAEYVRTFFAELTQKLTAKWEGYDLSGIPESENYLVKWEAKVDELTQLLVNRKS